MQVSHKGMLLGKLAPKYDPRTLCLASYIKPHAALPTPPSLANWAANVSNWPMYDNDDIGDCTCASAAHLIQAWTTSSLGKTFTPSLESVKKMYSDVTGWNPDDSTSDRGAVCLDILKYWRNVGLDGHKILAFVSVPVSSQQLIQDAIYLFGGVYFGAQLRVSAQTQDVWDVVPGDDTELWGGHAFPAVAYDQRGLLDITWGDTKRMTWAFEEQCCDEAYAIITNDFLKDGKAPNGFDLNALRDDLAAL